MITNHVLNTELRSYTKEKPSEYLLTLARKVFQGIGVRIKNDRSDIGMPVIVLIAEKGKREFLTNFYLEDFSHDIDLLGEGENEYRHLMNKLIHSKQQYELY